MQTRTWVSEPGWARTLLPQLLPLTWSVSCTRELLERLLWHSGMGAGTARVRPDPLGWKGAAPGRRLSGQALSLAASSAQARTFLLCSWPRAVTSFFLCHVCSLSTRDSRGACPWLASVGPRSLSSPVLPECCPPHGLFCIFPFGKSALPHLPFSSASRAAEMSTLGFVHRLQPTQLLSMPKECNWQQQPRPEG